MNRQIRRLGVALLGCYLALFAMLNYVQVVDAGDLNEHPANNRAIVETFNRDRGTISTADGTVIAESVPSEGRFERQRVYPPETAELFAHVTGYFSFNFGATGVEKSYNEELAGQTSEQQLRSLSDLFVDRDRTGDVVLSIRRDVQELARRELGERPGSVVALDPRDGSILAFWSFPTFDPNPLSSHDLDAAQDVKTLLEADPARPLLPRSYRERFFPGSTFKVVTAAAGVQSGRVTPQNPSYPVRREYVPPQTSRPLRNFGGSSCGGSLFQILSVSCNVAFAEMGAETLGPQIMIDTAEAFGFNRVPPLDLPAPVASVFPTDFEQNLPALAQSAIGQNDVSSSPLQMAMVAAAIANEGRVMRPHVMAEVLDGEGNRLQDADAEQWSQAVSSATAATVRQAMIGVVEDGTATGLAIPGVEVGGKTGTAQLGTDPPRSHAWIIGFAGPPGGAPEVGVAVIVEGQPGASEQTGGRVAAPIARAVMEAVLAAPDQETPPN